MRRKLLKALICGLFVIVGLSAQEDKKEKKVLKNADIVLMVQNHFDDETLLKVIEVSDTDFDISGDALVEMKNQGVSTAVLRAMLQAAQQNRRAAAAASAAPSSPAAPSGSAPSPAAEPSSAPRDTAAPAATPAQTATAAPAASSNPPAVTPPPAASARETMPTMPSGARMAMPSRGMGMSGMNPQQMAVLQSQLEAMGMGGVFGGMLGGTPSMSSYTPEQLPHVFLKAEVHKEKEEVPPSMALMAQTKFNTGAPSPGGMALRSLATQGLSFAAMAAGPAGMLGMTAFSMASGFMPGMRPGAPSMTYVWGLPGRRSSRELTNLDPVFELNYGDIPGVDPDAFEPVIVKLVQTKDNYRLVGATRTKMNTKNMMSGNSPENGKWISEQRWPTRVYKEDRGFYVLRVDQPFEPGEYAVVLRPVKGYKTTPSGLGGHAQVFYSVWDFSVPGTPADASKKKK
jgi:hypothetical protein